MDKVVVITGASSGIGAALGETLAARGARVVLVARREHELREVAARCGANALAVIADMTRREEVQRVVAEAIQRFGRIDVWVNNVGRGISRLPSQLTDADIDLMMTVNVKSALYGMQEVLPHFQERGEGQVINVSSMLGRIPYALPRAAYSASKHFLNALTANFRMEVQHTRPGILFTIVSPGVVYTDFGTHALHGGHDSRSIPGGQDVGIVAAAIAQAIETGAEEVYTLPDGRERVAEYYAQLGEAEAPD
jgi:NADP-dependent 3-hydroxy acid dehydrogenase YdfG